MAATMTGGGVGVAAGLGEVPLERLEAEITELAGHLAAAECRWIRLIGEFDRRNGWAVWGCRSCAHWLSWQCGLSLEAARERIRIARCLEELPLITAEFAAGRLSYSKVRALTRVATTEDEADLVDFARDAPTAMLERFVRAYRGALARGDDAAVAAHEGRRLTWRTDYDDGSLVVSARLAPEDGAAFLAAVRAAREALPDTGDVSADGGIHLSGLVLVGGPPRPAGSGALEARWLAARGGRCGRSAFGFGIRYEVAIAHGFVSHSLFEDSVEEHAAAAGVAPVEAEDELVEIAREM